MAAAAARPYDVNRALNEAKAKFSELKRKCQTLSRLEESIEGFRSDTTEAAATIDRLRGTLTPAQGRAVTSKLENVKDYEDAFTDYVWSRGDREDHDHVIGRVKVGQELRKSIQEMIEYLDRLGSHR